MGRLAFMVKNDGQGLFDLFTLLLILPVALSSLSACPMRSFDMQMWYEALLRDEKLRFLMKPFRRFVTVGVCV